MSLRHCKSDDDDDDDGGGGGGGGGSDDARDDDDDGETTCRTVYVQRFVCKFMSDALWAAQPFQYCPLAKTHGGVTRLELFGVMQGP